MLWSLLLLHCWCLPLAEPQEKPEGRELGTSVHWDEPPRAESRGGKGEKGSDSRWQEKSKLHSLHISSGRWRQQAPLVLFSRGEKLKPRKEFPGTHRGNVVEPDWYTTSLTPVSSDRSLIFGHPGPSSLPKHPTQPRSPHWALWDPTVCAVPHSVSHSTYSYWALTSPRLWGYKASLGFVSYRWRLFHALLSALKTPISSPQPFLIPSLSWWPGFMLDWANGSLSSLHHQVFWYPGVNMLFFLLALELKICLFCQMRLFPPSGLWIPFPPVLDPSLPSPSLIPLLNHSC